MVLHSLLNKAIAIDVHEEETILIHTNTNHISLLGAKLTDNWYIKWLMLHILNTILNFGTLKSSKLCH